MSSSGTTSSIEGGSASAGGGIGTTATIGTGAVSSSSSGTGTSSTTNGTNSNSKQVLMAPTFWEWDETTLRSWMQRTMIGAAVPILLKGGSGSVGSDPSSKQDGNAASGGGGGVSSSGSAAAVVSVLTKNILQAVSAVQLVQKPRVDVTDGANDDDDDDNNGTDDQSRRKKRRKKHSVAMQKFLQDPFATWWVKRSTNNDDHILPPPDTAASLSSTAMTSEGYPLIPWDDQEMDEPPVTDGGKLAQLNMGGLINALAGVAGGIMHQNHPLQHHIQLATQKLSNSNSAFVSTLPSAANCTLQQIYWIAVRLHRTISAKVKEDILRTTPFRIQNLLAADLEPHEFASIRKRVYDTVILGKGIHSNDNNTNDADDPDVPVSPQSGVAHDIDKFKKCQTCGNNDQSSFILDRKNGDVICSNCGTVVAESIMHEGSQFRKFEGEADRNHHGDTGNPLYSNAHNMSTGLSGVAPTTGAGIGGWGSMSASTTSGGKRNLETILRNAHAYTELNISQFGKTDRRTRVGYKDRQKKEAFVQMSHAADALNLHEAVVQRAKELFAGFRDDRELVQQFKGVLAACLCESFEQLSQEGKLLLKQQQQGVNADGSLDTTSSHVDPKQQAASSSSAAGGGSSSQSQQMSGRASRRNELHHATMAGKGGLLLDFSNVAAKTEAQNGSAASATGSEAATAGSETNSNHGSGAVMTAVTEKAAAAWDLEDCRSWLLDAARHIAQTWVEQRQKDPIAAKLLPTGPLEEVEGALVEHAITLSEQLELELHNLSDEERAAANAAAAAAAVVNNHKKAIKVVTPRVRDMTKLGIKWQHSHERGSGGKGGVGGSGTIISTTAGGAGKTSMTATNAKSMTAHAAALPPTATRTAGQMFILKTAKKLAALLNNDMQAAEAFHRELRAVLAQQETRKLKRLREEASRQRLQQMKRKPWLQARIEQDETRLAIAKQGTV